MQTLDEANTRTTWVKKYASKSGTSDLLIDAGAEPAWASFSVLRYFRGY